MECFIDGTIDKDGNVGYLLKCCPPASESAYLRKAPKN
jgi:hypothetical protein